MLAEANGKALEQGFALQGFQVVETERTVVAFYRAMEQRRVPAFGEANLFGE